MAKMKESGVAWINTMPEEWELKKIKYTLQSRNENNNPIRSRDILSLTAKQGVIPLDEKEGGGNKPKEDFSAYKLAYPGDIVMNSMNVLSGSVGLSKYFGCVSPVYYMLRPLNEEDDVRYFNYIFQTTVFQRSLLGLGNGILMKESDNGKLNTIRMRIPLDKLGNLFIPVPNSATQKKIADYLDSIIPDIDVLMKDIEKQIEILEEYKKSVITEAVTKGLNPDVEMKDSGNKWYRKIPIENTCKRIKQCLIGMTDGTHGTYQRVSDGKMLLSAKNVFEDGLHVGDNESMISDADYHSITKNGYPHKDDVLLCCVGTIGRTMVYKEDEPIAFQRSVIFMNCNKSIISPYMLFYCLQSNPVYIQERLSVNKAAQEGLYQGAVSELYICFPNELGEQEKIVDYLDSKCKEINGMIEDKKKQLETLEEYKKSLIYEYVTGKREVPDNE